MQATSYTVTYNGNTNTGGSVPVDGSSPYASGATVTVLGNTGTLVKTGYTFAGWNTAANGSSTAYAPAATFTIAGNTTLYAQWTLNTYTVTTTATNGTITSTNNPTVNHGSTTTVTGSATAGYYFTGVSGCSGTTQTNTNQTVTTFSYTTGTITGACTVAATFAINTYTLTYTAGANGSISGTSPQTVNHGSNGSAVTPVPSTGYHFMNWSDASTANPRTDTNVTGNIAVTANFAINTYTLTYTTGANGSITGTSPQTVNYGSNGSAVTPVPSTGYHFVNWSDSSTANPRTDTGVTANVTVTATFAINTYAITPSAGANGSINPSTPQTINYGSTTAFTVTPNAGYTASVGGTCGGALVGTTYTTNAITANCTVTASFTINTYTVTTTATNGTITSTTNPTVNYGSTTVTGSATAGYYFTGVSGCSGTTQTNTDHSVTTFSYTTGAITSDCTVTATFAVNNSMTLPATSGNGNITLATDTAGCGFYEVEVKTEAQVADDPSYDYPNGLVKFKLNCTTADVRITFTNATDLSGTIYRKYGPTTPGNAGTTQWYTFNNVTISGNTITLHLQDGQLGDDTGVDGVIVDAGGPGTTLQETTPYSVPSMSEWGMIIFMFLAGLSSVYYLRRRRA